MDSFEWNKIAGAVLFALLLSVGLTIFSHTLFSTEPPESPGYVVAVAAQEGGAAPAQASQPIGVLLASADPKAGANSAKKCGACHDFTAGGPNKVGPNLYGVVNRPIASHPGFEYDDAMKAFAEQAGTWTFEHLNTFIHDPKGTVPGTKMAFPGLKDDKERANVIAYLRTLSDNPAPLPEAAAAEPAAGGEVASAASGTTATDAGTGAPAPAADANAAPAAEASGAPAAPAAPAVVPPSQTESSAPAAQPALQDQATSAGEAPAAAPAPAPQAVAQAEAPAAGAAPAGDAAKGEAVAKRCAACHNLKQGGGNMVGPHLFGVVGRPVASIADYNYSDAMKAFSAGGTKVWDVATLDPYLTDPKAVVPGTKMAFPGVKNDADRANLIAYLATLK